MKKELWLRLKHYHFDHLVPPHLFDHVSAAFGGQDASTKAFASKLARKLDWTTEFAHRVIGEYKKFLYLGVVSDFAVTPSRVIDQIWHEHLLFSKGYREFCRDVLQRDFDHNPELVPVNEQTSLFKAQYEATLELYATEFNADAPDDIWGDPKFPKGTRTLRTHGLANRSAAGSPSGASDDTPLFLMFAGSSSSADQSHETMFDGGGGFTGGGGGSRWDDSSTSDASDGGEASDGGSSDGGSSCSSGCGGGE